MIHACYIFVVLSVETSLDERMPSNFSTDTQAVIKINRLDIGINNI